MIAPAAPELVVVGGLTIDRFEDGREEPGGSVIHISRAFAERGLRLSVVTAAGPEPAAQRGVDELRSAGHLLEAATAPRTVTFGHREEGGRRRLWLRRAAEPLWLDPGFADRLPHAPLLYAPVASELAPPPRPAGGGRRVGATLQGWLRRLEEGREVEALSLEEVSDDLVLALGALDLLVASREDLPAGDGDPRRALRAMRARFGPRPALVLTIGTDGAWVEGSQLGSATLPRHVAVPRRVDDVPTVGAGDIFSAVLLARGVAAPRLERSVTASMLTVADVLAARRHA